MSAQPQTRRRGQSLINHTRKPPAAQLKKPASPTGDPLASTHSGTSNIGSLVTAARSSDSATENVRAFARVRPFLERELAAAKHTGVELTPHLSADDGSLDLTVKEVSSGGRHIEGKEKVDLDGVMWSIPPDQAAVPNNLTNGIATQSTMYDQAVAPLAESVVNGRNACVIGVGYPHTGRSHTLWGKPTALQRALRAKKVLDDADVVFDDPYDDMCSGDTEHGFGMAIRGASAILDQLQSQTLNNSNRQVEVSMSMAELVSDKAKDLLAKDPQGYQGIPLRNHPVLGPSLDGLTKVPVASSVEVQKHLLRALRIHMSTDASSSAQVIFTVDVHQTDMVQNATDGSTMPVIRLSRFSVLDSGAWGRGAVSAAALRRVVDTLVSNHSSKKPSPVPYRDTLFTSLLTGPLGGACQTTFIGTVSPHFAHSDDTTTLCKFLQKVRGVLNIVKQNGGTASNMVMDMQQEIARLKKQLENDSTGAEEVGAEIKERENALSMLQATTNRAVEKYDEVKEELTRQQARTKELEAKRAEAEVSNAQARLQLTEEKQKGFAAAFKAAFQAGKQNMERKAQEAETAKQMKSLKDQLNSMKVQLVATKGERDRFQFEAMKLDKELKRVRVELHASHNANSKQQKELNQAVDANEALETKLNLARFESTNEAHDLRSKVLQLERERDEAMFEADARKKETRGLRMEVERVAAETRAAQEVELKDLRVSLRNEQESNRSLQEECMEFKERNRLLEAQVTDLKNEVDIARNDYETKTSVLDKYHSREQEKLLKLKEAHAIERESYGALVEEGLDLVTDLRQMEALMLARPTLHRAGWTGVVSWLKSLGLEHLTSTFQQHEFLDMQSVANIQEADLAAMKVLSGTRRKILAAAQTYRKDATVAAAKSDVTSPTRQPSASVPRQVRDVLDDLYDWCNDFKLAIDAEAEAASLMVSKKSMSPEP